MNPIYLFGRKATPLKRLLAMKAVAGGVPLTEYTATGNPLTFNTNVSKPLKSLLIPWTPSQSGSGDPSPSNVRPITGVSGVTVYHSGADTSDPDTINVTFPDGTGTVYGGNLDLTTGVLTVTQGMYTVDGANGLVTAAHLVASDNKIRAWLGLSTAASASGYLTIKCYPNAPLCNKMTFTDSEYTGHYTDGIGKPFDFGNAKAYPYSIWYWLPYGGEDGVQGSTADDIKAWFDANPVTFVAELQTPYTVQLTPKQLTALIGDNVIWSDTNGSNTAVYLKKG